MLKDDYKHKGLRRALIASLRAKGIKSEAVLQAMMNVPRHFFMDSAFLEHAYQDKAFGIGEGQTISQPYTVAIQSELLEIKKGLKVLEIGTGSLYQAAILAEMGATVYSIEFNEVLYKRALHTMERLGLKNIFLFNGDGSEGLLGQSPYQRILLTAAAPKVPDPLKKQLEPGGIIVLPLGDRQEQIMHRFTKLSEGNYKGESFGKFAFVPLLGKNGWHEAI
ncbi:MAG: protein-L-isoaspartate(D-aspartate) O-methyltransferase [Cytophagales bacterium]|nr:MAG: protein-L-isoaspartate(D-aspartate) O-methyltransferase [Cytophagales bacterium]